LVPYPYYPYILNDPKVLTCMEAIVDQKLLLNFFSNLGKLENLPPPDFCPMSNIEAPYCSTFCAVWTIVSPKIGISVLFISFLNRTDWIRPAKRKKINLTTAAFSWILHSASFVSLFFAEQKYERIVSHKLSFHLVENRFTYSEFIIEKAFTH
jgi:hypothetical protein